MSDLDAPYDPDPLAVGDRVRVRLSGECRCQHVPCREQCNGRTGTVHSTDWGNGTETPGHRIVIRFDRPYWSRCEGFSDAPTIGGLFCRAELERIS